MTTKPTTTKLTFTDPVLVVAFTQTPEGAVADFNAFGNLTQPEAVAMLRFAANKLEEVATARLADTAEVDPRYVEVDGCDPIAEDYEAGE